MSTVTPEVWVPCEEPPVPGVVVQDARTTRIGVVQPYGWLDGKRQWHHGPHFPVRWRLTGGFVSLCRPCDVLLRGG